MKGGRDEIRWIALAAFTAFALYLCWLMLKPFIDVLVWASVLVIVFYPVHKRIVARTGRPALSAAASCLLVIVTFLIPVTLITLALFKELPGLFQNLQAGVAAILDPSNPVTGRVLAWLEPYVDVDQLRSQAFITERLQGMSGMIAQRTLGLVGGIVGVVVQMFFVIFTMYYLFRDGESLLTSLRDGLLIDHAQSEEIFGRTQEVIGASVYGVLVIAAIQGALGGLAFWALGLPSALVWGVVMMFLSMIPMAGAFVVWVPAAGFLALQGHWIKALLLTAWGILVIGIIDNFLRPKLVGRRAKLHELAIFFSVLGGLQLFGVIGLVMGPVALAITLALLEVIRAAARSPSAPPASPARSG